MNHVDCTYCSGLAIGLDENGDPTCGNEVSCSAVDRPLPRVIELSCDDDSGDESEDE